jgi:hypothetical protein
MDRPPYYYGRQKLWEAVNVLVGDGAMRDRLGYAQSYLLLLRPEHDLPEELRDKFRALMKELAERTIHYSYRPSRVITRHPKSGRLAQGIFDIYTELQGGI